MPFVVSFFSAPERVENFGGQGLEELFRDLELAFGEADFSSRFLRFRNGPDLGDRDIPLAQDDLFAPRQPVEVAGEVRFRLVNVELFHGLIVN